VGVPKKPTRFFGYVPGCLNPAVDALQQQGRRSSSSHQCNDCTSTAGVNDYSETERDGTPVDWSLPLSTGVSDCSISRVSAAEKKEELPVHLQPESDVSRSDGSD